MTIIDQSPLNPLQRAYLMGRNAEMPLGGVAMHDFREFKCDFTASELEKSVFQLVQKYPVLRTYIDDTELVQKVLADVVLNIDLIDLSNNTLEDAEQELARLRMECSHNTLPLDRPLWRMCLISLPEDNNQSAVLFVSFDGLIVDGYAISVMLNALFNDNSELQLINVRQPPASYFTNGPLDRSYWENQLIDVEEVISLPWKQDLDTVFSPSYKREGIVLSQTRWQAILALGSKQKLLPNTVLTTALFEVLALWVNDNDLLLSMPISNSILYPELSNHSTFIAVTYNVAEQQDFVSKAKILQKDVLGAMSHTSFSGVELGKMLFKKTGKLVSLPVAVTNGLSWGADSYQKAEYVTGVTQTPQLALDIRIRQTANNDIAIDFDYAEQALSSLVISQILQTLEQYLLTVSKIADLQQLNLPNLYAKGPHEVISQGEEEVVREPVVENYLIQISENLYRDQNDKTALIFDDKLISYQTLGKQVAKIANQLALLNINKGDVVAICLPKSPAHVAVTLACSLANIIWLPVDMDSPAERMQFMVNNCRADLIITDRALDYSIKTMNIDDILNSHDLSETLDCSAMVFDGEPGYYLYTSGSTGTPKCVVMNHLATANVVEETNKTWNLTRSDVMFSATPFHHDMSVYELFAAMSLGASLVVPTQEQAKSGMDWARLIKQYQVSVWSSVPAIVDMLLVCAEPDQIASLKLVSQGGDYVKPTVIDKLREYLPKARLFSIGGPTETTIWSVWHEISNKDVDIIPYGDSFKHNQYYIMNEKGQHCPHFVVGTMCMSGVNLANGYLKEGVINQNDFNIITTPEGRQVRVFKTSDRGFFREDGKIIFSGRKEGYLKIRGVRIAASEVELSLTKHPLIRDAIVMACANPQYQTNEMVVAYVTENSNDVAMSELRQFLKGKLPNSHIPSRWLPLNEFPLTRNKKVDRKRIGALAEARFYQKEAVVEAEQSKRKTSVHVKQIQPTDPLESVVIKAFSNDQEQRLDSQTEILSLGLRPKQLGQIAKQLSYDLQKEVTLYTLAKSTTLGGLVVTLSKLKKNNSEVVS